MILTFSWRFECETSLSTPVVISASCGCHVMCHVTELWLSWLEDEEKLAGSDIAARRIVYQLFDRAVNDYLCKLLP